MEKIDVAGHSIAYERVGSGPPLLLLHGLLLDRRIWRPQLEAFGDRYTVVAWDAPGAGGSSDPPEDFSLARFADVLAEFIEVIGLDRPHVLGLSWGGGLAIDLAVRHPEHVRSLILTATYAGWAGSLPAEEVGRRLSSGLAQSELPPARFIPTRWVPELITAAAPDTLAAELVGVMSDFHPVGFRSMVRAFADADLSGRLGEIAVPTMVLHGDADRRSPIAVARQLHRGIPAARLVTMRGAGHLANLEFPDAFNRHVGDFLADQA